MKFSSVRVFSILFSFIIFSFLFLTYPTKTSAQPAPIACMPNVCATKQGTCDGSDGGRAGSQYCQENCGITSVCNACGIGYFTCSRPSTPTPTPVPTPSCAQTPGSFASYDGCTSCGYDRINYYNCDGSTFSVTYPNPECNYLCPLPDCNTGISCSGSCSAPTNTCSVNNGTQGNCIYTTYSGGGSCNQVTAPNQTCSVNNCSPGYSCSGGSCVPTPTPPPTCSPTPNSFAWSNCTDCNWSTNYYYTNLCDGSVYPSGGQTDSSCGALCGCTPGSTDEICTTSACSAGSNNCASEVYQCDSSGNWNYVSSQCNPGKCGSSCGGGGTPKYKCSGTSCIRDDTNGNYATSNCDNACGGGGGTCDFSPCGANGCSSGSRWVSGDSCSNDYSWYSGPGCYQDSSCGGPPPPGGNMLCPVMHPFAQIRNLSKGEEFPTTVTYKGANYNLASPGSCATSGPSCGLAIESVNQTVTADPGDILELRMMVANENERSGAIHSVGARFWGDKGIANYPNGFANDEKGNVGYCTNQYNLMNFSQAKIYCIPGGNMPCYPICPACQWTAEIEDIKSYPGEPQAWGTGVVSNNWDTARYQVGAEAVPGTIAGITAVAYPVSGVQTPSGQCFAEWNGSGYPQAFRWKTDDPMCPFTNDRFYDSLPLTVKIGCKGYNTIDAPTESATYNIGTTYTPAGWGTFCAGPNGTNRDRVDPYLCDQGTFNNCQYIGPVASSWRQDIVDAGWTCGNLNPNSDGWNFNFTPNSSMMGNKTLRVASINDSAAKCVVWDNKNITIVNPPVPTPTPGPAWIQTTSGDVHSNTRINTPGGP